MSSLLLAPLARGAGRGPCLEQRAAALQQPRAGNPQGAAGSAESAPVPARHLRAQELPGAVAPVPWHGQRPGALPCPAHTSSSWDPRQYRGSAGRPERRDFPCHGLSRVSPQAPHRTACSDLEPQRALLGLGGTGSPRAGAFSVRACVPRAPATPAGAPALPELPWPISGTGEVAAKRNGTVPSLSRVGARPGRSPAPGDSQPGSGRGSAAAVTQSSCRAVPEVKVAHEGELQGEGERTGATGTKPRLHRGGPGRASRAGLVTWGARPSQDAPRARGRAHARCHPAALPECHVRRQGPRETAALANHGRHCGERGQWWPAGGERGRRPTRGGGKGACPDRQPMGGAQRPGQRPRPMGGGR